MENVNNRVARNVTIGKQKLHKLNSNNYIIMFKTEISKFSGFTI